MSGLLQNGSRTEGDDASSTLTTAVAGSVHAVAMFCITNRFGFSDLVGSRTGFIQLTCGFVRRRRSGGCHGAGHESVAGIPAQGGHDLRSGAGADLGSVLVVGDVPHPVRAAAAGK